jgi:hypothetical protein
MRYEDWTFRETEVRSGEHADLRSALALNSVPDYDTLYHLLARRDLADVARVMNQIVRRIPGRWRSPASVVMDATGPTQGTMSSFSSAV